MLRFVVRHGLVRLIGRRAVPVMLVWDVAVIANKARQIPIVDRGLRRGASAARRGAGAVATSPRLRVRPRRPRLPGRPSLPGRPRLLGRTGPPATQPISTDLEPDA
ncbi:MAG: hypothetical protein ABI562_02585 [Chloroflexota bacterium]